MKRVVLFALVIALTLPLVSQVKSIAFAEEAGWPPFTTATEGRQTSGLSFDLVTELGKRLGIPVTLDAMVFTRVLALAQEGTIGGITAISKNPEREQFLLFSEPTVDKIGAIYAPAAKASGLKIAATADFKGLTLGIVTGNSYGTELDTAIKDGSLKFDSSPNLETAFRKLAAGRVDVVLAVNVVAAETLKAPEFAGKFAPIAYSYQKSTFHFAFPKKSPTASLVPKVNEAIAAMKADGTMKRILAKYGL